MTKVKKLVATAVAAVSMGVVGVIAFADHWDGFNFSLEGNHWDNYIQVSRGVTKHDDWNTPASVTVNSGNVSPTNKAYIRITASDSWPESYDISREVEITSHNGVPVSVLYNTNASSNLQYAQDHDKKVYLYAVAGGEDVRLGGFWTA